MAAEQLASSCSLETPHLQPTTLHGVEQSIASTEVLASSFSNGSLGTFNLAMLPRELTRLVIIAIVKGDFQCLECSAKFNVLAILTLARVSALLCEEIIQVLQPAVLLKKQFRESKAPAKSVSRANHDKNMCKHPHYGQASSFEAVTDVYNFLKKFQTACNGFGDVEAHRLMAALCDKLKEKEALRDAPSPEDLTSDQRLFAQLNLSRDTYYSLHEGTAFSHWMEVVKVKAVMRKRRVEKAAEKVLPRGT